MNQKKIALLLSLGLSIGLATLSGTAFASNSTASEPVASIAGNQPNTEEHCDMHKPGMMDNSRSGILSDEDDMMDGEMCDHERGMMGGKICDHECGMMGGKMDGKKCDHERGIMGGKMDGKKCDHERGMMGGKMDGKKCDHERGKMGGNHMGGMMGGLGSGMMMQSPRLMMVKSFDLSSEQRSSINKLSDALRHKNWAAMGSIMDESAKLRDLYAADKRDPSAIGKEYSKIFDLQRQMIEAIIDTENRVDELLTPEQRTQLKNLHHKTRPMH